jgi:sialate O-acetylesterase
MAVRRLAALLLLSAASAATAQPRLGALFSDHAVLQRGRPIAVWGEAAPGEQVAVTLGEARASATAGRDGRWRVELPALAAGGPYALTATSASGAARAEDVMVGDVWLCSGQSNMELQVRHALDSYNQIQSANDPRLRLLNVPRLAVPAPTEHFTQPVAWAPTTPETVGDFSAACYYMVRELRAQHPDVPIGAINASWGGSPIRAWLDEEGARAALPDQRRALETFRRDPAAAGAVFGEEWAAWWRRVRGDAPGAEPWRASDRLHWSPVPAMSYWEQWGDPRFASFNGMVWMRRRFTLTEAEAAQAATLSLGVIDEVDETFVNGVAVGGLYSWEIAREYRLPAGLLRAGENEILVNVFDGSGSGGLGGPAERLRLAFADGSAKPLGEGWEYSVVDPDPGMPPRPAWDAPMGLTFIRNGMIAPLRDYGIAGVAWYQGESDVGQAGYADRLAAMMAGWRRQFRRGDLPFLIVSLANYGPFATAPVASGWAELREQQRLAVARDPHAALVIAMDLGERLDIHPANKIELGRRLARAAEHLAYGAAAPAGPEVAEARREGEDIVVRFTGVTGALRTWSSTRATAFELCGQTQESCRFADAVAEGSNVRIRGDARPATRVRYAWADSPVVNLYDEAPLPPGPFEVPIRP